MAGKLGRPCAEPRCPGLVTDQGRYCPAHAEQAKKEAFTRKYNQKRNPFYDTAAWKKCRQAVISANPICEAQSCTQAATEVHHIENINTRPDLAYTLSNLQALCKRCHMRESQKESRQAKQGQRTPAAKMRKFQTTVTVLYGPPAAGKTTYVQQHAKPGDLILDIDSLFDALSAANANEDHRGHLLPFVCEARDAIIKRLSRRTRLPRAWVVSTVLSPAERRAYAAAGATVYTLIPPVETCLERCRNRDGKASRLLEIIRGWYSSYQKCGVDLELHRPAGAE